MSGEAVDGRVGGVYPLPDEHAAALLAGDLTYEVYIDAALTVNGVEIQPYDMHTVWCEPTERGYVVMSSAPYWREALTGTLGVVGTGILYIEGLPPVSPTFGPAPFIAEYADVTDLLAQMTAAKAAGASTEALRAMWARVDRDEARRLLSEWEKSL